MAKKCTLWILTVLILLSAACWVVPQLIYGGKVIAFTPDYVITEQNGQQVLQFHLKSKKLTEVRPAGFLTHTYCILTSAPEVKFTSFGEMKSRILKGDLTENELGQISRFDKDETGKVKVLNLDTLYEPVLPASFGLDLSYISWTGSRFSAVYLRDNSEVYTTVSKWSKDAFDKELERLFKDHPQALKDVDPRVRILDVAAGVYKDSVVVRYSNNNNMRTWKTILYTISDGQKTMHIMETFDVRTSDTIPNSVKIFYEQDEQFLSISVASPDVRPTYEELASISIRKVK